MEKKKREVGSRCEGKKEGKNEGERRVREVVGALWEFLPCVCALALALAWAGPASAPGLADFF